jgi:RNA polymerase sigma-70 factor (ECF subfamily)
VEHGDDLAFAAALARGERQALARFEREVLSKLGAMVARFRLSADELDELKQLLRQQLLVSDGTSPPKIATFSGRGPLAGWVRIAAVRAAIKLTRRRSPVFEDDALVAVAGDAPNAELAYVRAQHRTAFREAFRNAIAALNADEQNLLRQHFLDGLTFDALAALHRVHKSTIGYRVEKARTRLLKHTRTALMKATRLSAATCDSIFRQAQSQFAVTFTSLFR